MKHAKFFQHLLILVLLTGLVSCRDEIFEERTLNVPVYLTYEEFRISVVQEDARELEHPGKIYFKDNYIFINEISKGIHIINNSDPSNPENVGFIYIPGNVDIAIKENILYADSYIDLVALDLSDLSNIELKHRIKNVFPYTLPETGNNYGFDEVSEDEGVVVEWEVKRVKREVDYYPIYPFFRNFEMMDSGFNKMSGGIGGGGSGTTYGVGGSMARFMLYADILYTIDENDMHFFDISNAENPLENGSIRIGWGIETLFPYGDKLFIGTQTGMLIYDLVNPLAPRKISEYRHITSCDPVVVDGDYAYVTLRAGNLCGGNTSQLDIIDISNLEEPQLMKSYVMEEPYGLGINNSMLFVCDGDAGLKIYDASQPLNVGSKRLATFSDINAYDVIPIGDILFMIGEDGLAQYDCSDISNIVLLSLIEVK
ncbi:LVIVD repeat-containing protein [Bacteroidota bacterium]